MRHPPPFRDLVSLRGHRALITGAAAGIGRAVAYRLAEAGAALHLVDVDEAGLTATVREIAGFEGEVHTHRVDLARKDEIERLWDGLSAATPDVLVNNAGIYPLQPFLETDEEALRRSTAVNVDAVFWMCRRMIHDRAGRGGVIVNVGSIEAVLPFKTGLTAYSAGKAAVIALSRSLAREYGRRGFRVNVVVPGGIVTPGTRHTAQEVLHGHLDVVTAGIDFTRRLPLGRLGTPDEVARVVLVLCSGLASYVEGAVVAVDGGFLSA